MNLRRLLFEQITEENLITIQDAILDKFEFWLPFVETRDIKVETNKDSSAVGVNQIKVKILFNIKQDPNTLDSVTLNFTSDTSTDVSDTAGGSGGY